MQRFYDNYIAMPKQIELQLSPEAAETPDILSQEIRKLAGNHTGFIIRRKSLDARKRNVLIRLVIDVYINEPLPENGFQLQPKIVSDKRKAVIAGAGPAGLFAAIKLLELGIKPIIIERGKDVRERRRDLALITRQQTVNPESNYCFGEGGAGTYSDGKLYTRSSKRGDTQRILNIFHQFGAEANILYEAHPHIGTNRLPAIITRMREYILEHGGELFFNTKLTGIVSENNQVKAVQLNHSQQVETSTLILATGHSARDIFELLHHQNIYIEAKPFALGVRIEHPQTLIDGIQYHCEVRGNFLPAASYSLVDQQQGRGVFSFCMCPGGIIAPAATAPGEIVVNGWSPSKRNNPFANSGVVVSVGEEDFKPFAAHGPLAGLRFQQMAEQDSFVAGSHSLKAPAQSVMDFVNGKISKDIPPNSYLPGTVSADLMQLLPAEIGKRLHGALQNFGKKLRGYLHPDAVMLATESRTSSPVKIPRDKVTMQHIHLKGLYPCGEGAGYAGGIVSAAMDGERVAEAVSLV